MSHFPLVASVPILQATQYGWLSAAWSQLFGYGLAPPTQDAQTKLQGRCVPSDPAFQLEGDFVQPAEALFAYGKPHVPSRQAPLQTHRAGPPKCGPRCSSALTYDQSVFRKVLLLYDTGHAEDLLNTSRLVPLYNSLTKVSSSVVCLLQTLHIYSETWSKPSRPQRPGPLQQGRAIPWQLCDMSPAWPGCHFPEPSQSGIGTTQRALTHLRSGPQPSRHNHSRESWLAMLRSAHFYCSAEHLSAQGGICHRQTSQPLLPMVPANGLTATPGAPGTARAHLECKASAKPPDIRTSRGVWGLPGGHTMVPLIYSAYSSSPHLQCRQSFLLPSSTVPSFWMNLDWSMATTFHRCYSDTFPEADTRVASCQLANACGVRPSLVGWEPNPRGLSTNQ